MLTVRANEESDRENTGHIPQLVHTLQNSYSVPSLEEIIHSLTLIRSVRD